MHGKSMTVIKMIMGLAVIAMIKVTMMLRQRSQKTRGSESWEKISERGGKNGKANHVNDNDGDVGNYRWPNFENPDDCGDYIPHKKQKKLTDYFSKQNGGLPSISLKVPGTPSIASTSHKRGTFQEPVTSRHEPSTSKPNDKSVTKSRDEINRSKHDESLTGNT